MVANEIYTFQVALGEGETHPLQGRTFRLVRQVEHKNIGAPAVTMWLSTDVEDGSERLWTLGVFGKELKKTA